MRRAPVFLMAIIAVTFFGYGVLDVAIPEFIPPRPYSSQFINVGLIPIRATSGIGSDLLSAAIIILFFSALLVQIANRTTGITIVHTGFTPNPNLTSSPGAATILQIIPFLFTGILVFGIAKLLEKHTPNGGL